MEALDVSALRRALEAEQDEEGELTRASVARLCRAAVQRWGVSTELQVRKFVQSQATALGSELPESVVGEVINELLEIGDVARVHMGGRAHLARTPPRWVRLAGALGALVGSAPTPPPLRDSLVNADGGCVRHLDLFGDVRAVLRREGVTEQPFLTWLGTPGYRSHSRRRGAGATQGLEGLWAALSNLVGSEGLPVSDQSSLRALLGEPGDFYGKLGDQCTGRWREIEDAAPGVWLGARRGAGKSERHWLPIALAIDEERSARILDLFDWEEFRWALLSRGLATGQEEAPRQEGDRVSASTPLPAQVRSVLALASGGRRDGWAWELPDGVGALWRYW